MLAVMLAMIAATTFVIGGFAAGVLVALLLLFARLVDAHGGDIVTLILGKHARALVGRPGRDAAADTPAPAVAGG